MSKKSKSGSPFPEMNDLLTGIEDLMRDEHGNPLTPDHPQYQKLATMMENMVNTMNSDTTEQSLEGPQGQA